MKNIKSSVRITLIITAITCAIPLLIYLFKFSTNGISNNSIDFGLFGDFMGGILNPLIAISNTVLLVLLSYYIAWAENNRQVNEYRFKAYLDFTPHLSRIQFIYESKIAIEVETKIKAFRDDSKFLFGEANQDFEKKIEALLSSLDNLIMEIEEDEEITSTKGELQFKRKQWKELSDWPKSEDSLSKAKDDFDNKKSELLSFLQKILLQK